MCVAPKNEIELKEIWFLWHASNIERRYIIPQYHNATSISCKMQQAYGWPTSNKYFQLVHVCTSMHLDTTRLLASNRTKSLLTSSRSFFFPSFFPPKTLAKWQLRMYLEIHDFIFIKKGEMFLEGTSIYIHVSYIWRRNSRLEASMDGERERERLR